MKDSKPIKWHPGCRNSQAFTLVELLVVIAILGLLAALLLPALQRMREGANASKCLSHMKQLVSACHSFSADNEGRLPPNYIWEGFYPEIALKPDRVATGLYVLAWTDLIRPYVSNDQVFSCPSLRGKATTGYGGISSASQALGIGLNFHTIGSIPANPDDLTRAISVANASKVVIFGDAGGGSFSTGDFEARKDTPGCGSSILRGNTETADQLMPRHGRKANIAFLDGHVQLLAPTEIDWGTRNPATPAVGWADATWK